MKTANNYYDMDTTIYTTGASLQAVEVEINGIKQWRWVVVSFEEDSFKDGKSVDVYEYSKSKEKLFKQ